MKFVKSVPPKIKVIKHKRNPHERKFLGRGIESEPAKGNGKRRRVLSGTNSEL